MQRQFLCQTEKHRLFRGIDGPGPTLPPLLSPEPNPAGFSIAIKSSLFDSSAAAIQSLMPRPRAPIPVRSGRTEFLKINAARRDWRDSYHWVLSLRWPQFFLFLLVSY